MAEEHNTDEQHTEESPQGREEQTAEKAPSETEEAEEPGSRTLAVDAVYALTGLAHDALQLATESVRSAQRLPDRAQDRVKQLRDLDLRTRRQQLEERVRELRDQTGARLEEKASEGRAVTDEFLEDDRVRQLVDQVRTARSQVKGALTSLRRTAQRSWQSGTSAGREQAETARVQTKAAATSVGKAAEMAAETGRNLLEGATGEREEPSSENDTSA